MKSITLIRVALSLCIGSVGMGAFAQASTVTQQFLGASVPNPVVAVELDAAPNRIGSAATGQSASAVRSSSASAGGGLSASGESYGARLQSQGTPPMYTGVGTSGGAGATSVIGAHEASRLGR